MIEPSSRFAAGDLVQVLSRQEILRTLDDRGCLEGVPFMPEMLPYCGQTFRVSKRAHKTCDFVNKTGLRALPHTVHLDDLRCDGRAHAGCQARCLFFWKDAWLRRPGEPAAESVGPAVTGCTLEQLATSVYAPTTDPRESARTYSCQATRLPEFTRPLSPWNLRAYLEDYESGNVRSLASFAGRALYRAYDGLVNLGIGLGRPLRGLYDFAQRVRGSRALYPGTPGRIARGQRTPTGRLDLEPGEFVRVKDQAAILATVDENGRNRGLSFSAEMAPFCGRVFRVLARVDHIIDEKTGRMLTLREPCIVLDGVTCCARYNKGMIFCPRATYAYWRELWLERTAPPVGAPPTAAQRPHEQHAPALSSASSP